MTTATVRLARVNRLIASGQARALRIAHGVSPSVVAKDLGVDPVTVWRWETGRAHPHAEHALAYEAILSELAAGAA